MYYTLVQRQRDFSKVALRRLDSTFISKYACCPIRYFVIIVENIIGLRFTVMLLGAFKLSKKKRIKMLQHVQKYGYIIMVFDMVDAWVMFLLQMIRTLIK